MGPIGRKLHFSLSCRCESGGQGRKNFQIRLQVVCSTGKLLFYLVRVNIFFVASLGRRNYIWIKIHSVGKIHISFFYYFFFFFQKAILSASNRFRRKYIRTNRRVYLYWGKRCYRAVRFRSRYDKNGETLIKLSRQEGSIFIFNFPAAMRQS